MREHDDHNDHPRPDHDERAQPVTTFLVIPYFNGDRGRPGIERPLSASIVSWLCPSIVVNGQPGKNAFERGVPTSIIAGVANWGSGTTAAPVLVQLWWSDPATSFTKLTLFGQSVAAVPTGGGVVQCPPIVGTIPKSAPQHVCLLAYVSSPLDSVAPGSPIDPVGDRHWAQLNLVETTTTVGLKFQTTIWIGNPFQEAATFLINAQLLQADALPALHRLRREETVRGDLTRLAIFERRAAAEDRENPDRWRPEQRVTIPAGERRAIIVAGELSPDIPPGHSVALEVVQRGRSERGETYGSIGIIVRRGDA